MTNLPLNSKAAAAKAAPAAKPLPAVILDLAQAKPLAHNLIEPSKLNPRREFDKEKLAELAESIARDGMLQPLLVRPHPKKPGHVEIVAGERRWRAVELLQKAGRAPADYATPVVQREIDDATFLRLSLVENIQRQDLNPMEEADRIAMLVKTGITSDQIAFDIGKTRRWVNKRLELVKLLTPAAQATLREGEITVRQAEAVAKAPAERQKNLLADIKRGLLSTEASIMRRVTANLPAVGTEHFKFDDYKGEIIEGEKDYRGKVSRYFADVAQFEKLQSAAITSTRDALAKEWAWVKVLSAEKGEYFAEHEFDSSKDKTKAGAVIEIDSDGEVTVHAGLIKAAPAGDPRNAKTGALTNGRKAASEPPVTQSLLIYAKRQKTDRLQAAIVADAPGNGARMAKILTCIALMGDAGNVAIRTEKLGRDDRVTAPELVKILDKARGQLPGLVAAAPKPGAKPGIYDHDFDAALRLKGWAGERGDGAAAAFALMLKMSGRDLDALFAALVAARCGTFNGYKSTLGDEPLALAAAAALKVDMAKGWGGSATGWADYLKLCKKARLLRLVADLPRLGLDRAKCEGMKTAALAGAIAAALKLVPGLATAAVPVELQFVAPAIAEKALKAKLPPIAKAAPAAKPKAKGKARPKGRAKAKAGAKNAPAKGKPKAAAKAKGRK